MLNSVLNYEKIITFTKIINKNYKQIPESPAGLFCIVLNPTK